MVICPNRDQKIRRLTDEFSPDSVHRATDSTGFTTKQAVKQEAVDRGIGQLYATSMTFQLEWSCPT